jgi:hypothetical protein
LRLPWNELQTAARKLGLTPQLLDIRKVEDIAPAFADATSQHADALIVSVDALTAEAGCTPHEHGDHMRRVVHHRNGRTNPNSTSSSYPYVFLANRASEIP